MFLHKKIHVFLHYFSSKSSKTSYLEHKNSDKRAKFSDKWSAGGALRPPAPPLASALVKTMDTFDFAWYSASIHKLFLQTASMKAHQSRPQKATTARIRVIGHSCHAEQEEILERNTDPCLQKTTRFAFLNNKLHFFQVHSIKSK